MIMIMQILMSFVGIIVPIQMMVFGWLLIAKAEQGKPVGRIYLNSWKTMGNAVRWLFAPVTAEPSNQVAKHSLCAKQGSATMWDMITRN